MALTGGLDHVGHELRGRGQGHGFRRPGRGIGRGVRGVDQAPLRFAREQARGVPGEERVSLLPYLAPCPPPLEKLIQLT